MITQDQLDTLADIFNHSERPDKMSITLEPISNTVTIVYEDIDEQWFNELVAATGAT